MATPLNITQAAQNAPKRLEFSEKEKEKDVRQLNIIAAKAVADMVRTSLGPRGMDKLISSPNGENVITNDGATILQKLQVKHPAAKMLVELSKAQDIEAGDGTTSVVVIAGALLGAAQQLLGKSIHPSLISESFQLAARKAQEILEEMSNPLDLSDRTALLNSAITSLNSKVVSQYSNILAPIAVDAILRIIDPATASNVDLRDIRIVNKVGGTLEDTELVDGIVFNQKISSTAGGPSKIANAKIALIQFCLSPPKTNIENSVVITDYTQMDRVLREERNYILNICKRIQKTGCNVLLIQKSILRDATTDLSLHFLAKMKIMVIQEIERDEIEFICKTLGCQPIASVEGLSTDKLGSAKLVEEQTIGESKIIKVTGVPNQGKTVSIICRGSNKLVVEECDRSIHDALCVIRSLVKKKAVIAGGGAPEIECSLQLVNYSKTLTGTHSVCVRAYAEALEIVPYTLAENAGLNPIAIVTELKKKHAEGIKTAGINVRKGAITDILSENVIQPLLVSSSAFNLASETISMLLKIDDMLHSR
eukprot:TRINITY_DN497_c1_g1_i1.p1 TRINITY_DN497_c1_g1~~TRINITY_DN497_c1_g1_i1.p1  ORF type:complete len:537 (-),score=272.46 TRINITY_DN497_c1_g1_i1:128-1738(-)